MKPTHEAIVERAAFVRAVRGRHPRRRRVRVSGARSNVPDDILIYAKGGTLVVDTPMLAVRLSMRGAWHVCVAVPAALLVDVTAKLAPQTDLSLIYSAGSLIIDGGIFALAAHEVGRAAS